MKLLPVFLVLLMVSVAQSATITVNLLTDIPDGSCNDGSCTLRDAILVAENNDTIDFSVTGTIILSSTLPTISKELYIEGPGQENLTISGNDLVRPFIISEFSNGTTISKLSITNGKSDSQGGAVNIASTSIVFNHVTFSDNESSSLGGAIFSNYSTLQLNDCVFSQNEANTGGGAISFYGDGPDLSIKNSSFTDNTANNNGGGALMTEGQSIDISNSVFQGNQVLNGGDGGAIFTFFSREPRAITITGSTFSNNSADAGGAIYLTVAATIQGSLFENNYSSGFGGAINITDKGVHIADTDIFIQNSTLSNNSAAASGGAIRFNTWDTKLFISNSTIVDNIAGSDGSGGLGGGISLYGNSPGAATFKNVILANNSIASGSEDCDNKRESNTTLGASIDSRGWNRVENTEHCWFNNSEDIIGTAPAYSLLADNGGTTRTHALPTGSSAIDSGSCTDYAGDIITVDQRNMLRHDGNCDVGAYEYGGILAGDFNNDQDVDLTDLILSLQITTGSTPGGIHSAAALGLQKIIGTEEAIYVLQQIIQ